MPPHVANSMKRLYGKWKNFSNFAIQNSPQTQILSINPMGLEDLFEEEHQ